MNLPRLLSINPKSDGIGLRLSPARRPLMLGGRLRFWATLLILLLLLIPIGLGQWDMVIAVIIGLAVGNALSFIRGS